MNNGTNGTKALGNTITNAKSRKWVFTLNNHSVEEHEYIKYTMEQKNSSFVIGEEIGESGTPHLQGYVEFKNPISFSSMKKINNRLHIEKARGSRKKNIEYCSKDNQFISTFPLSRKEKILLKYKDIKWKEWQQQIIDICESESDNRTIHWFYEQTGNVGKSFLCKYLYLKYNVIIADGKKDNIFNQVKTFLDNHPDDSPKIILCDVPRTNIEYINYGAIEALKNGLIYSGKYEGGVCCFDHPHVIIFANTPPEIRKLSIDRWIITQIYD